MITELFRKAIMTLNALIFRNGRARKDQFALTQFFFYKKVFHEEIHVTILIATSEKRKLSFFAG